jgi:hypothetical protein
MAELPKQLDDIIGDLMKKEQDLNQDDPSSSITGSQDKAAAGEVHDGPMSDNGAKGSTGNQQPSNTEISGRAGGGRNGKSSGQMVGDTAPTPDGGTPTPTRMTPSPFENGSVKDSTSMNQNGGTGGGKLSGWGEDGLHGDAPPPTHSKTGVAAQQSQVREEAESLALELQKQRKPTGDLESAIVAMKQVEAAANGKNGLGVSQGYHAVLNALQAARASYVGQKLSRIEANSLSNDAHKDMYDTQAEDTPAGYEEMTGAYFRSLSESASGATQTSNSAPAPAPNAPAATPPAASAQPTPPPQPAAAPATPTQPATPPAK